MPLDKDYLRRLRKKIEQDRKKLEPFRETRMEILKQYAGSNYSGNAAPKPVPVNLMELFNNTYSRILVPSNPRVDIATDVDELRPSAWAFELAVNKLAKNIRLKSSFKLCMIDALISIGIMKTGLNRSQTVELGGYTHDVGQPFSDPVDLDNWVHDTNANRFEQCEYYGDLIRLPLEDVKDSGLFKNADQLQVIMQKQEELGGIELVEDLSSDGSRHLETLRDQVEIWNLWIPHLNRMIWIPVQGKEEDENKPPAILRSVDWDGPDNGPYHFLYFNPLPNNLMPVGPATLLYELHMLIQSLMRKLRNQGMRQRNVLIGPKGSEEVGNLIKQIQDGDVGLADGADQFKELRYGGIDQPTLPFLTYCIELFKELGGNINLIAGLSTQADTLGQEQILQGNASARVESWLSDSIDFYGDVYKSIAYFLWIDPFIELPLTARIPGLPRDTVNFTYTPEMRQGDFLDYNFEMVPYSMLSQTPEKKLQRLRMAINDLAPIVPAFGGKLNPEELVSKYADYLDMDELNDIFEVAEMDSMDSQMVNPPTKPNTTTRRYERVSRAGASKDRDGLMTQIFSGGATNGDQRASLGRR